MRTITEDTSSSSESDSRGTAGKRYVRWPLLDQGDAGSPQHCWLDSATGRLVYLGAGVNPAVEAE